MANCRCSDVRPSRNRVAAFAMFDAARWEATTPPARPAATTVPATTVRIHVLRLIATSLYRSRSISSPAMASPPSRARYTVTLFAVALAVITYVDRVAISVSVPYLRQDLGLSPTQIGWALAAFGWAYALFEIPGGWLGDRIGPRRVLMRIVIWWSLFTAATGWAWNASSLILTRALFGAGEAGGVSELKRGVPTR